MMPNAVGEYRVLVAELLDVFVVRWTAQRLAQAIGFASGARQEIAIAVSELATNILKYGVRGQVRMERIDHPAMGAGIELIAEDEGPPLADLATALQDGYSDRGPIDPVQQVGRGGIGGGLGAVIRFTDSFEYRPDPVRKSFRAVRYLVRPRPGGR